MTATVQNDSSKMPGADLAGFLLQLRQRAGNPPVRSVASRTGRAPSTINEALRGRRLPSAQLVDELVRALNGTAEDLDEARTLWSLAGEAVRAEARKHREAEEAERLGRLTSDVAAALAGDPNMGALRQALTGQANPPEESTAAAADWAGSGDLGARILAAQRHLDECAGTMAELQDELVARTNHLQLLADDIAKQEERATQAEIRARLGEEQAHAVDALMTRALEGQAELFEQTIDQLEKHARRREWIIGTLVALVVGVASILVSHFAVGL